MHFSTIPKNVCRLPSYGDLEDALQLKICNQNSNFVTYFSFVLQSEKKIKHKKSKDKDKHKENTKLEKKHKRRSREETSSHRDELEEFLNGSASPPIDAAYEAI